METLTDTILALIGVCLIPAKYILRWMVRNV